MQPFSKFIQSFGGNTQKKYAPNLQKPRHTKWKAGGFPMYKDPKGQLWVCTFVSNNPRYGGKRPQMPKGHPDAGEKPVTVGAREASEETGIPFKALMKNPISVSTKIFKGETHDYLMHVYTFKLDQKYPTKPNNEGKGLWLKYEDALMSLRRDQITFLLLAARKMI